MTRAAISSKIITAYKMANYRVCAPVPFVLNIGRSSEPLQRFYDENNCTIIAFITVYRPFSELTSNVENVAAQTRLQDELKERFFLIIAGIGEDSANLWPGEPSVLILDISQDEAKLIGIEFQQNAMVWTQEDVTPQLAPL